MATELLGEAGLGLVLDGGAQVLIVEELLRGGMGVGEHVHQVAQGAHGAGDHPNVAGEGDQLAQGHHAVHHHHAAHAQQQGRAQVAQEIQHGHVVRPDEGGAQGQAQLLLVLLAEALLFVLLLGEGLDHPGAGDVLLGLGGQHGVLLAQVAEGGVDLAAEQHRHHRHDGRHDDHQKRQLPAEEEQQDQRADKPDQVFRQLHDAAGQHVAQTLDVARHAGHDFADVVVVVEAVGHLLQVVVQVGAHVEDEVLAELFKGDAAHIVAHRPQNGQPQQGDAQGYQQALVAALDHVVHQPTRDAGSDQPGRVGRNQEHKADHGVLCVGFA